MKSDFTTITHTHMSLQDVTSYFNGLTRLPMRKDQAFKQRIEDPVTQAMCQIAFENLQRNQLDGQVVDAFQQALNTVKDRYQRVSQEEVQNQSIYQKIRNLIRPLFSKNAKQYAENVRFGFESLDKCDRLIANRMQSQFQKDKADFTRLLEAQVQAPAGSGQPLLESRFYNLYQSVEFAKFVQRFDREYAQQATDHARIYCLASYFHQLTKEENFFKKIVGSEGYLDQDSKVQVMVALLLKSNLPISIKNHLFDPKYERELDQTRCNIETAVLYIASKGYPSG